MKRLLAWALTFVALIAGVATFAWADGAPDPSLDADGRTSVELVVGAQEDTEDLAFDSQGRIVIVGTLFQNQTTKGFVARFLPNGSLDKTFGGSGFVVVDGADLRSEGLLGVAVDSQDRVVAGGDAHASGTETDIFAVRLLANGGLDSAFSGDGLQTYNISPDTPSREVAADVAIDPQGRIVLAGSTSLGGGHPAIVRLTPDGRPDPSLFGRGAAVIDTGAPAGVNALEIDAAGRIFLAGRRGAPPNSDFLAARLTPGGALDPGFGGDGFTTVPVNAGDEIATNLAMDAAGRVVLVGRPLNVNTDAINLARLEAGGALDTSFGSGGTVEVNLVGKDTVTEVEVDRAGRIVTAGSSDSAADAIVARFTGTGAVDRTFGSAGVVQEDYLAEFSDSFALGIDSLGRYVFAGRAISGTIERVGLARLSVSYPGKCAGRRATRTGTKRRDVLRGTPRRDVIAARGGNDVVRGLGGNDLICGGGGKDRLFGGPGKDKLLGQGGADRLRGGPGKDALRGGPGRDNQRS